MKATTCCLNHIGLFIYSLGRQTALPDIHPALAVKNIQVNLIFFARLLVIRHK